MHIEVVTLFPELIRDGAEGRRAGARGRARHRERGLRGSARAHERRASHGGRSALRRRAGHGAQARADVEGDRCRRGAGCRQGAARVHVGAGRAVHAGAGEGIWSKLPGLVLVAGRYEGLDERVIESRIDREVSVGDYVLSGGEFPALVVIDAVARLLPGVLGDERSAVEESFDGRFARLAALHAAGGVRRPEGARGSAGRAPR